MKAGGASGPVPRSVMPRKVLSVLSIPRVWA